MSKRQRNKSLPTIDPEFQQLVLEEPERLEGVVKRVIAPRGFGFIRCESTGQEYFVHCSCFQIPWESVQVGLRVSFALSDGGHNRPPRAVQCQLIED